METRMEDILALIAAVVGSAGAARAIQAIRAARRSDIKSYLRSLDRDIEIARSQHQRAADRDSDDRNSWLLRRNG